MKRVVGRAGGGSRAGPGAVFSLSRLYRRGRTSAGDGAGGGGCWGEQAPSLLHICTTPPPQSRWSCLIHPFLVHSLAIPAVSPLPFPPL